MAFIEPMHRNKPNITYLLIYFEPHIKYLKARCQKSLNILKVLSRTEWGADRTTLLKLYRSLVRSKLDYGCVVYGSASKTALAKLDPVHNQGLRLSLGAFRSSPVESLYVEAHEPPLEIRREKLALQYTIKLKANPGNPAYDVVFNPKYQHLYANKDSVTDSFGIYCKKLKKAKMDVGEIAINSIPDVPIWDSEPVIVDFTLSEFDKSSTSSTVFKSRFNEVKQKYLDFCHIYTDGSKVETKVASAYVCPYGIRGYRLRDGCSIFTAEVEAINKALTYVKTYTRKRFVIFSDSMSVLQAIESQESKNPLVNRVLQACQHIFLTVNLLHFVGFQVIEISEEMKMLIVQQKMLYQKHSLRILNFHVQTFLWKSSLLSHLCGRNDGIRRLVTNCTPSCPKLMRSITQDAQIEKMKLLSVAFE